MPSRVYQFKIELDGIEPEIWRRILVPEAYSFWDLHVAIQDAMGWLDCHLHVFRPSKKNSRDDFEIGIPDDSGFADQETVAGWEVPIKEVFTDVGEELIYLYDFGDDWAHRVVLEEIVSREKGQKYPKCIGGSRACPPEDCGGVCGYERLLEAISDPENEEHEEIMTWLGGSFDSERFDPQKVRFDSPRKRWKMAFEET